MDYSSTEGHYVYVAEGALPDGLRFDVPSRYAGQHTETAFADWPKYPSEAGYGSTYKRVTYGPGDGGVHYYIWRPGTAGPENRHQNAEKPPSLTRTGAFLILI